MRFKSLVLVVFFGLIFNVKAQQFEIGKATDAGYSITADTAILAKAIKRTLGDGTIINSLRIESVGAHHYLVAEGTYKIFSKLIAMQLVYNIGTRTYYAKQDGGYVTCASAACLNCSLFKENGKIIGCKCSEKSTISNQCNFTFKATSAFYLNIIRAKQMVK
ncbi:MAG: hypothetical protein KBG11_08765 [Bacteroidia bacterium]|nr:hypothetical protein [Bacteroidia bacterium]